MLNVDIYFNEPCYEHIRIENVIMVQSINNELVILYKIESYDYKYTEIRRFSMNIIDYYLVGK